MDGMSTAHVNYYAILQLDATASQDDIKRNFRRLIKLYHPNARIDATGKELSVLNRKSDEITKAYKVLSNPEHRRAYDEILADLDQSDLDDEEESNHPTVRDYAVLNATVRLAEFRGFRRLRNSGIINSYGDKFEFTYVNGNGELSQRANEYDRTSLLAVVSTCEHFQECIFDEISGENGELRKPIQGVTFVTSMLFGRRMRWSCSQETWEAIQHGKQPHVPFEPPNIDWIPGSLGRAVIADLQAGGILSRTLPGYEERPAQIQMARRVADALESGDHLVIEASTGTGKSLAYLLPIIRSGKVALISTANKALQEQLFYKDIPFVQRHIRDFRAALVKGMGNYLCLDRLDEERSFQRLVGNRAFAAMEELLDEPDAWDGDLDLLPLSLPGDVRGRVGADSDLCAWRSCSFYGDCYVRKMRERSREAQIIVVNHTLLLLDAAMDGYLLPERDVIVIDEAHHLEEEATRAFTITVTPGRVASLLAQRRLRDHVGGQKLQDATDADIRAWSALERAIRPDARGRQHLTHPLEEGLRLATTIDEVASDLMFNRPETLDDKEQQLYEKLVKRTRNLAADLRVVFGLKEPDDRIYYVERKPAAGRRGPQPSVSAAPLAVTELLREKLFDKISTIATSATLAVGGDFKFFRKRVGLPAAQEIVLPLTFDYESNALLYVPRMRLEPAYGAASDAYLKELAEQMRMLVEASDGRAFLLFSSQNALHTVLDHLTRYPDSIEDDGYSLVVQGRDVSRVEMLRQFREQPRAVLFGLKSFWEGVDVAGEALSLVAIDKLPFDPPDDPVNEARVGRMKEAGENWFGEYTLPQAILRLKQGIGRLLRTSDDCGVMAILDKRLYTKGYGRQVLAALPPARRTADIADVRRFFESA